jgi:hypothetical protein
MIVELKNKKQIFDCPWEVLFPKQPDSEYEISSQKKRSKSYKCH